MAVWSALQPESFHEKGRRIPNPARPPPKLAPKFQIVGTIPACQTLEEFEKNCEERKVEDLTNYYWMEKEPFKATTPGKRFEVGCLTISLVSSVLRQPTLTLSLCCDESAACNRLRWLPRLDSRNETQNSAFTS